MAKFKYNVLTGSFFDLIEDRDSLGLDTTDSPIFTGLTIGIGAIATDYFITFDGEHSNGIFTWMEDEDYFQFSDGILIPTGEQIYFRDTALAIQSTDDGWLNLVADIGVEVNAPILNVGSLYDAGTFGCNAAAPQAAYASGGALAAYGAGVNGLDTGVNMAALHALVIKIRAALVANGIMS